MAEEEKVVAVIMVGGPTKGTRFRPLSFNVPKPLFPLAGQPMIHHPISACKRENALVMHAIVGWKSSIGRWSRVQASLPTRIHKCYVENFHQNDVARADNHAYAPVSEDRISFTGFKPRHPEKGRNEESSGKC